MFRSWYWRSRYWRAFFFGSPPDLHPVRRRGKVIVRPVSWPVAVPVPGVEVRTYAGYPEVSIGSYVTVQGAAVAAGSGVVDSEAIQNPTDEELALLLLLPHVGGDA